MSRFHVSRGLAMLLATILLAACSGPSASPSVAPTDAPSMPSTAPSAEPTAAAIFPVNLTDDEGTAVAIASEPMKIVSLSPANTEILFELGVGDRVVATDSASDYPAEAGPLPDVADFANVDVETIVSLEPDLIVAAGLGFTPPEVVAQLRELEIPVVVVYAPTVDAVLDDIELIGAAVGRSDEAGVVTAAMRAEIDAIAAAVADAGTPPRTFYDVGYDDTTGQIFAPADQSFVAEMLTLAGADTITTGDPNSYEIPLERLIDEDPALIILGVNAFYAPTADQVAARTGWDVLSAVKSGAIRQVPDTEITRPGPRLALGLRNLAGAIWPDLTLPAAP